MMIERSVQELQVEICLMQMEGRTWEETEEEDEDQEEICEDKKDRLFCYTTHNGNT